MAGISAADTTSPNMDLATEPAETDAFDAAVGESPVPVIYTPDNGYTILQQAELAIVAAGDPIRVVWEYPTPMDNNDALYKVLATIDCPSLSAPAQLVIHPNRLVLYDAGLDDLPTVPGYDARLTGFVPTSGVKYIYEISAPDADTIVLKVWDESGGEPLGSALLDVTGILTNDGTLIVGWPAQSQVIMLEGLLAAEGLLINPRGTPVRPYLVKIHSIGVGNLGPTAVAVSPASAPSSDIIEGTVIGAFSSTHATETTSFNYTLVAGTGDTNNASFTIFGADLKAATPLAAGSYSIRVQTKDRFGLTFADALTITVV